MFAKKTPKPPLAIKRFGSPSCPRAVTSPQPWLSFEASLSNTHEQGFVPCWGHHTHQHITHPHSQLSRKTKSKNQQQQPKKSTLLAAYSHCSNVTDLGWKFPGRSFCFHSVPCWETWWGGVWEMSWGCQSCSLPWAPSDSSEVTPAPRGDHGWLWLSCRTRCSLISWAPRQEQVCEKHTLHPPYSHQTPARAPWARSREPEPPSLGRRARTLTDLALPWSESAPAPAKDGTQRRPDLHPTPQDSQNLGNSSQLAPEHLQSHPAFPGRH